MADKLSVGTIFSPPKSTDRDPSPASARSDGMPGSKRTSMQWIAAGPRERSKSPAPTRLQKASGIPVHAGAVVGSAHMAPHGDYAQPSLQDLKQHVATHTDFDAPSPLIPPPRLGSPYSSRPSSRDGSGPPSLYGSRPTTPTQTSSPVTLVAEDGGKQEKKRSWFGKSKKSKDDEKGPLAWIAGHPQKEAYNHHALLESRPVPELWNNVDGNCFVHFHPKSANKGPCFKVDSAIFASSPLLTKLAFGDLYSSQTAGPGGLRQAPIDARMQHMSLATSSVSGVVTPPRSPMATQRQEDLSSHSSRESRGRYSNFDDTQESHLYLPVKVGIDRPAALNEKEAAKQSGDDLQTLIDYRNVFAFLCGQSLVGTERRSSFFHIFMIISQILNEFQFSNIDGSTFGEVASSSFDNYVGELALADVRGSREKIIESIVLGERMRSVLLYNEAFTHGVGRHDDLIKMRSPKLEWISPVTRNRLSRAALDLEKRVEATRLILEGFEFPALFSGIMTSKTSEERKEGVRFDDWRDHFMKMRYFVMQAYKHRYGNWPPKASSKKNDLETSGLNRIVLRDVYHDMCAIYDLLVDRNNLTTRTVDGIDLAGGRENATVRALRKVLSEYDRSSPPVKPPVPFDLPNLPTLRSTRPDFGVGDTKKDVKAMSKKLKDDEIESILRASWNGDAIVTDFVNHFRDMERKASHGSTITQITDQRIGQWIFMYVVLQALPLLACDAPGLRYTKGCEYFLCEPPRSGVPWAKSEAGQTNGQRQWFKLESGGVVSLPSDIVEHGIEGIYHRSHCWSMAEKWSAANPILNSALHDQTTADANTLGYGPGADLPPPPGAAGGMLRPGSAGSNRSNRSSRLSSLGLGLEALPMPAGLSPNGNAGAEIVRPRSAHQVDSAKTFDAILGNMDQGSKKGKKR